MSSHCIVKLLKANNSIHKSKMLLAKAKDEWSSDRGQSNDFADEHVEPDSCKY